MRIFVIVKQLLRKTAAVVLTFVVLFSTLSFTVEKHYCGSFLVDIALFSKAKSCGMGLAKKVKSEDGKICKGPKFSKRSCCKDEKIVIDGQDELKTAADALEFTQPLILFSSSEPFAFSPFCVSREEMIFKIYDPPNLEEDLQVLYEVFRI